MSIENPTPFPALAFRQYNLAGELNGVAVIRGTFRLTDGGPLIEDETQSPLVLSDQYDGDPQRGALVMGTDLVPFRPGTDVTLIGHAFSPGGDPAGRWECGVSIGPINKNVWVTGPRKWRAKSRKTWRGLLDRASEDAFDGWTMSEPEAVTYVPLDWRLAFGGVRLGDEEPFEQNPVGRGRAIQECFRHEAEVPAPQIEAIDDFGRPPDEDRRPHSFGPISPWWTSRYSHAGTYDENWQETRHPLLPRDFDYRFYQYAPEDQIAEPWLKGHEPFELRQVLPMRDRLEGRLPGLRFRLVIDQGAGAKQAPFNLDGVHFDFRPGVGRVFLTWRATFPWPERRGVPRIETAGQLAEATA